jgi:hypothetical protein
MSPPKLNREEFAAALKRGRGAALMHVMAHGLDDVEDLVLTACFENQAYDRQCEDLRSAWLYKMFKDTPAPSRISEAIVSALDSKDEQRCIEQVCDIAGLMARDGNAAAYSALREFVRSQPEVCDGVAGGHALVALDGVPAVVDIARRLGRYLIEHPDEYVDSLDFLTEGTPYFNDAFSELKRCSLQDTAIAAYFAKQDERREEQAQSETVEQKEARMKIYRDETLREFPIETILATAAEKGTKRRYFYSRFGRVASDADLNLIFQRIREETDPEICKRLLWVFSGAALPHLDARIWELAGGEPSPLRAAAMKALAFVRDPLVGEFARRWLREKTFTVADDDVIELFVLNYQAGDEALIMAALAPLTPDDDDAHALATHVQGVCGENNSPELAGLLEWIYRTNPCTICRRCAVDLLLDSNSLRADIANECLHDAASDTQELVQGWTGK